MKRFVYWLYQELAEALVEQSRYCFMSVLIIRYDVD